MNTHEQSMGRTFTRRAFCRASGALSVLALSQPIARALDQLKARDGRLVVIHLRGGNDGFNTIIPLNQEAYERARPTLAIRRNQALRLTADTGLHPALAPLADLYADGSVEIHCGVGFPEANRTHAQGNALWETVLQSFPSRGGTSLGIARTPVEATRLADHLAWLAPQLGEGKDGPLPVVEVDGFDTHIGQAATHGALLGSVGHAIRDFQCRLSRDGASHRVTTLVYSELGRSLAENAFGGTDHGTIAPLLLIGGTARAGIHGDLPDLSLHDASHLPCFVDAREFSQGLCDKIRGLV